MMGTHKLAKVCVAGVAAIVMGLSLQALAEDPFPTELDASSARAFIGKWTISMEFNERTVNLELLIKDIDGKVGGTIDSDRQPEPRAIDSMSIDERGNLIIEYETSFGSQNVKLQYIARLVGDGLEGTIRESSGLFEAAFTAKAAVDNPEARGQRRRSSRASANSARLRLDDGESLRVFFTPLKADSDDHNLFANLSDGEIFEFVGGRATKLFTDVDMVFPDATVKTGNAAPNYPGVYSLWLKKAGDGWNLVFNEEADIWGTMHNAEADAVEIALETGTLDEPASTFKVELEETENGGKLRILWGADVWTADFKFEAGSSQAASAS